MLFASWSEMSACGHSVPMFLSSCPAEKRAQSGIILIISWKCDALCRICLPAVAEEAQQAYESIQSRQSAGPTRDAATPPGLPGPRHGARLAQGRQRLRALVEGLQVLQQPCQVLPARDTHPSWHTQDASMHPDGPESASACHSKGQQLSAANHTVTSSMTGNTT